MAGFTQSIRERESTSASANNNVIICRTVRDRNRLGTRAPTAIAGAVSGDGLVGQSGPFLIRGAGGILVQSRHPDRPAIMLHQRNIIGARRVGRALRGLRPTQDQPTRAGACRAGLSVMVPRQTAFTSEQEGEVRGVHSRADLGNRGIPGVNVWHDITRGKSERG